MAAETVELHKLKLAELKQECLARGLEAKGNKQDLINRLQAYLEEHGGRNRGKAAGRAVVLAAFGLWVAVLGIAGESSATSSSSAGALLCLKHC
uniref:SAP domain-containing ribonucleoprotein n=1 Tax=Meleagris gallopavo TaxID=9103 RepID=G1MSL9_MELGA